MNTYEKMPDPVFAPDPETTVLEAYACIGSDLTGICFPPHLQTIGQAAFAYCKNLAEVVLPAGITVIPEGLFYCCPKLKKVTFTSPPTHIGRYAFAGCRQLTCFVVNGISAAPGQLCSVAEPYAFYGCGGDIREPLAEDECHNTPSYESAYYRQQSIFYQDLLIAESHNRKCGPHWDRRDPDQFRWMPGIESDGLQHWLNVNRLQLPAEYHDLLLRTNGASLFRQMLTFYAVPTADTNEWQAEHSLELLNSPEYRRKNGVPPQLYLLGVTSLGTWFGVTHQHGQPVMADFYAEDHSLRTYRRYDNWKRHLQDSFGYDPTQWELEDELQRYEQELLCLEAQGELLGTTLQDIRNAILEENI